MNCLEFRRLNLSEPGCREPHYVAHINECDDCARYADGVEKLDRKIGDALRVPVPEDLVTRIKLRQVMQDERTSRRARPWQYAVAASVFLMVAISGVLGYQVYTTNQYVERLTTAAVDHTRVERQGNHFVAAHEDPILQQQRFQQVLASFGGKAMSDELAKLGEIMHVQVCALKTFHGPVMHFVLRGKEGMITVYYVIGKKLGEPESFASQQYEGMLIPAGGGNIAIIGGPGESLKTVADTIERSLVWEI